MGKGRTTSQYVALEFYLFLVLMATIYLRVSPGRIKGKWQDDNFFLAAVWYVTKTNRGDDHSNEPVRALCIAQDTKHVF